MTDKKNNGAPEEALQALFDEDSFLSPKGQAFLSKSYYGKWGNIFIRVKGNTSIHEEILKKHKYTVHMDHQGFIHVELLDYCNFFWDTNKGKGCLSLCCVKTHDKQIQLMKDHMKETGDKLPQETIAP